MKKIGLFYATKAERTRFTPEIEIVKQLKNNEV